MYRRATVFVILMMILPVTAACQSAEGTGDLLRNDGRALHATLSDIATSAPVLPTRTIPALPTATLVIPSLAPPTASPIPATDAPPMPSKTPFSAATLPPTFTPAPAQPTAPPLPEQMPNAVALFSEFSFGQSVEGRDLRGYRIGSGLRTVILVGSVHGGFEENTTRLIQELAGHFRDTPEDVRPDITLLLIPALNPDGVARGRVLEGRFNANGVDLNRNWGCGWQPTAYFRDQLVSAGTAPLSEPETQALAGLILMVRPAAVLFYHAAADGVFAGTCGGDSGSAALGEIYGSAADYASGAGFSAYPVTGTAPAWVNSMGIPAVDVELASAIETEFERNLRGVLAVQDWLTGAP